MHLTMESPANPVAALSPYELEHLVTHLAAANRHADIHQLLALETAGGRNAWCEAKEAAGLEASYTSDLARAWEAAEASRSPVAAMDAIDLTPRYALASSSFRTQAGNIPVELLSRLVRYEVWSVKRAVQRARQVESAGNRAAALVALLSFVDGIERRDIVAEALDAVRSSGDTWRQASLLIDTIAHLDVVQIDGVLAELKTLPADYWQTGTSDMRHEILIAAAVRLATLGEFDKAVALAFALPEQVFSAKPIGECLARLMTLLPDAMAATLLAAAALMKDAKPRDEAVAEILPSWAAAGHVNEAIAAALELPVRDLFGHSLRVNALCGIAQRLEGPARDAVLDRALATFDELTGSPREASLIATIASLVSQPRRGRLVRRALNTARAVNDPIWRFEELVAVAAVMHGCRRVTVLRWAIITLRQRYGALFESQHWLITKIVTAVLPLWPTPGDLVPAALGHENRTDRTKLLLKVCDRLPAKESRALLLRMLDESRRIDDRAAQLDALVSIQRHSPRVSALYRHDIVAAAAALPPAARATVWIRLSRLEKGDARRELERRALDAAADAPGYDRSTSLSALSRDLSRPLVKRALAIAATIEKANDRVRPLLALAARTDGTMRVTVVAKALEAVDTMDDDDRPAVLAQLAPWLSQPHYRHARVLATRIKDGHDRAAVLVAFAVAARGSRRQRLVEEAIECLRRELIRHRQYRPPFAAMGGKEIVALAEIEAFEQHPEMVDKARNRLLTLARIARGLPARARTAIADAILQRVTVSGGPYKRVETLDAVVPYLTRPRRGLRLVHKTLASIDDHYGRAVICATVARHLRGRQKEDAIARAIAEVAVLTDGTQRLRVLKQLAADPLHPDPLSLLGQVTTFDDPRHRVRLILAVMEAWPNRCAAEARRLLQSFASSELRAIAAVAGVAAVAEADRSTWFADALEAIDGVTDPQLLAENLAALAPFMTSDVRPSVVRSWRRALHVLSSEPRQKMLADLARLAPLAAEVGGAETMTGLARATLEAARWWP